MSRIWASVYRDLVLLYRNGFLYAAALVVVMLIIVLRLLPEDFANWLIPMAILGNVLVNGFYFSAAMMLLEKSEHTLEVHFITPLRSWEYVSAKIFVLSVLSLLETLIIVFVVGVAHVWLLVLATIASISVTCLAGLIMVTRYSSINQFLMPSVAVTYLLIFPIVDLLDLSSSRWLWLHPVYPSMVLLESAFRVVPGWEVWMAIVLSAVWTVLGVGLCQRIVRRFSTRP